MPKLILIIISIFYFQQGFGQNSNCRNLDSTLCYANAVYPKGFPIVMDKKWEYSAEISTMNSPLIADIDGDCIPEIIVANNIINGNPPGLIKDILVLNSMNGKLKFKITTPYYNYASASIAIGNIIGDNKLEILLATSEYNNIEYDRAKIICYDYTGTQIWISNRRYGENINSIWKLGGTLALADFNQDGKSEVYIFNEIFSGQTGRKLINGGNNGLGIGHVSDIAISITIASQLDGNANDLELAAGFTIYKIILNNLNDITGNISIPINLIYNNNKLDGFTSIADINNDNLLDVIVTKAMFNTSNNIYIYCVKNDTAQLITFNEDVVHNVLGPSSVFNNKLSKPQIIITSLNKVLSLSFNNTNSLKINWEHEIIDESGIIYSTIFDLNNDDAEEIILRDHNSLRILSLLNESPVEIVNVKCGSGTGIEGPIIADLDNSGESKICIPCSPEMFGNNGRLTVFGSPDTLPGWTPARNIWNQYNYHVLNINDDGTVPQYMKNNATYKNGKYNNFMVQESLLDSLGRYPQKAASLYGKINCSKFPSWGLPFEIDFTLYNDSKASEEADSATSISFFDGNPYTGGKFIGSYQSDVKIMSGDSIVIIDFLLPYDTSYKNIFMLVNAYIPFGEQIDENVFIQLECDYTDNLYQYQLPPITKTTAAICNGESYNFYDDTISTEGTYYYALKNIDGCDSVILEFELNIEDTINIATTLATCDTYTWNGNVYTQSGTYVDSKTTPAGCESIATLNLTINKSTNLTIAANTCDTFSWLGTIYDETGIYTFATQTTEGCDSILKLELTVIPPDSIMLPTQEICRGDSLLFLGTWYKDGTNATIKLRNQYQCDSFITFELRVIDTLKTIESLSICQGDSVRIFDEWQSEEGSYQKTYQSVRGCDSLAQVQLIVNRVIVNSDSLKICSGDSVFLFNEWQKVAGIYTKKYQSINGCDSTEQVDLIIEPLMVKSDSILICEGDSIIINGKSYSDEGSYQTILSSTIACDTIFNFHLKHSPLLIKTENYTICEGDSVFINGNWLVPKLVDGQAQVYVYEVREDNCKTEVTANFTINYSQITNNKYILCPEDSILLNNTWVNSTTELTYTLQSSEGCDSVIQAKITKLKWPEPPVVELDCEDNVYNVSIIADENWDVLWSDMTNGLTTVLKESPAWVKVSTDENCEKIFDINIESLPDLSQLPSFDDQKILEGNDINVKVDLPETEWEVLWLPESAVSCDTCFETTINVATNTTITLELKHLNGCTYVRSFDVIVEKEIISIVIPNIINPTSTSENNIWTVEFPDGYIVQEAKVYDRWGNVVYNNDGSNLISWDGKIDGCEVVPGVYVYLIRLINPDGKTEVLKGDVTVIR